MEEQEREMSRTATQSTVLSTKSILPHAHRLNVTEKRTCGISRVLLVVLAFMTILALIAGGIIAILVIFVFNSHIPEYKFPLPTQNTAGTLPAGAASTIVEVETNAVTLLNEVTTTTPYTPTTYFINSTISYYTNAALASSTIDSFIEDVQTDSTNNYIVMSNNLTTVNFVSMLYKNISSKDIRLSARSNRNCQKCTVYLAVQSCRTSTSCSDGDVLLCCDKCANSQQFCNFKGRQIVSGASPFLCGVSLASFDKVDICSRPDPAALSGQSISGSTGIPTGWLDVALFSPTMSSGGEPSESLMGTSPRGDYKYTYQSYYLIDGTDQVFRIFSRTKSWEFRIGSTSQTPPSMEQIEFSVVDRGNQAQGVVFDKKALTVYVLSTYKTDPIRLPTKSNPLHVRHSADGAIRVLYSNSKDTITIESNLLVWS